MSTATLFEAKTHLSALVTAVEKTGEPVTITRHGRPVARLVPIEAAPDRAAILGDLRQRAREQGIAYDCQALCAPLPPEAWGELAGPPA
jgi:prevent-host-death family protein